MQAVLELLQVDSEVAHCEVELGTSQASELIELHFQDRWGNGKERTMSPSMLVAAPVTTSLRISLRLSLRPPPRNSRLCLSVALQRNEEKIEMKYGNT